MDIYLSIYLLLIQVITTKGQALTACTNNPHGQCINLDEYYCNVGYMLSNSGCAAGLSCCFPFVTGPPVQYQAGQDQCGVPSVNRQSKVVGGLDANIIDFPWMVSIQNIGQHICGGTIVDSLWILTAAHCLTSISESISIVAGTTSRSLTWGQSSKRHYAQKIYRHGRYKQVHQGYDIALIKLTKPLDIGSTLQRRICLPDRAENYVNHVCVATGWGYTHEPTGVAISTGGSPILRQANLPVMTTSLCEFYLGYKIPPGTICAGYKAGGEDTCQGDSGGPLMCQDINGVWKQAGVVSYGRGCGRAKSMGIYTNVTAFRNWIDLVIKNY